MTSPIRPKHYAEFQQLGSFAIKELEALLRITTFFPQYTKCAAAHFAYLGSPARSAHSVPSSETKKEAPA
jgi:hypothetical protein